MKRAVAAVVTVLLLGVLFARVDRAALLANLRHTRITWFALGLLMFVPQIAAIAWRWKRMVSLFAKISLRESVSLVLASATMNLVLPSKAGDLTKALFLKRTGTLDLARATNVVLFEKMLDVGMLAAFMLGGVALLFVRGGADPLVRNAGLAAAALGAVAVAGVAALYFIPVESLPGLRWMLERLRAVPWLARVARLFETTHEVVALLQSRGARRGQILATSALIWVLHLVQIYFFFLSLDAAAPPGQFVSLVPLAIFIGLLPLTVAGFGTRDAAIILFFPQFPREVMLGVALYINLRYILPALAGLPSLNRYIVRGAEQ